MNALCHQIRIVFHTVGNNRAVRVCTHRFTCRVVCVEHRSLARLCPLRRHILKKPCLCPRIVLHRLVIVEVILRQVREHRRVELNARDAPLVECV